MDDTAEKIAAARVDDRVWLKTGGVDWVKFLPPQLHGGVRGITYVYKPTDRHHCEWPSLRSGRDFKAGIKVWQTLGGAKRHFSRVVLKSD